jgi:cytolysin-activating lysine-acyltransferase
MSVDSTVRAQSRVENRIWTLGAVSALMLQNKLYHYFPMACLAAWIDPAILLNQIRIFYNEKQLPIGYMTWAYLAPDVEDRWINDPKVTLHLSEWNEGEALWVMDFVAPLGHGRRIMQQVKDEMFLDYDRVKSLRRNANGTTRCVTAWRR